VDFEEIICYSQTVILFLLVIAYLINLKKQKEILPKKDYKIDCPSCGYFLSGKDINFCSKCGNIISHSEGLRLKK